MSSGPKVRKKLKGKVLLGIYPRKKDSKFKIFPKHSDLQIDKPYLEIRKNVGGNVITKKVKVITKKAKSLAAKLKNVWSNPN
jgi:hypothetical protein